MTEPEEKLARLRALLGERYDVVVLRSSAAVAWLTGGGRSYVATNTATGVAAVIVGAGEVEVVTAANETDRLREEELGGLDARWEVVPWNVDLTSELPRGPRVATDVGYAGVAEIDLTSVRVPLLAAETERYRSLGRDAAEALTAACRLLSPQLSEYAAAARVAAELVAREADPVVLLVAGDERRATRRHPLPTAAPLGRLASITVCARRDGLIANLSRLVAFTPPPVAENERYRALQTVEAAYLRASTVGATWSRAFLAGTRAYAAAGFDADEWTRHHQGGPTGYEPRDFLADENASGLLVAGQALAWNPTAAGLKVEDTMLVHHDGLEVLTSDGQWPSTSVGAGGPLRPQILLLD
ncbi:MAG: M24 family metallopeptidase [bacterium]